MDFPRPVLERNAHLRFAGTAHGKILPGVSAAARLHTGCRRLLCGHPGFHALQLVTATGLELVRWPDPAVSGGAAWLRAVPASAGRRGAEPRRCRGVEAGYYAAEPARVCEPRRSPLVAVSEGGIHCATHAAHLCERHRTSTDGAGVDVTRILLPQTLSIPCLPQAAAGTGRVGDWCRFGERCGSSPVERRRQGGRCGDRSGHCRP